MKYLISIQSISDLITNSSSETFCRIGSKTQLQPIYDFLKDIFRGTDYEMEPVIDLRYSVDEDWLPAEIREKLGDQYISLEIPYDMADFERFLRFGIEGLMKERYPLEDFIIIYDEE